MGRKRSLRKSITCAVIVVIVLSSGVAYGQSEILRDAIYPVGKLAPRDSSPN